MAVEGQRLFVGKSMCPKVAPMGGMVAMVPALGAMPAGVAGLALFLAATMVIVGVALIAGRVAMRPYTASSSSATP